MLQEGFRLVQVLPRSPTLIAHYGTIWDIGSPLPGSFRFMLAGILA